MYKKHTVSQIHEKGKWVVYSKTEMNLLIFICSKNNNTT